MKNCALEIFYKHKVFCVHCLGMGRNNGRQKGQVGQSYQEEQGEFWVKNIIYRFKTNDFQNLKARIYPVWLLMETTVIRHAERSEASLRRAFWWMVQGFFVPPRCSFTSFRTGFRGIQTTKWLYNYADAKNRSMPASDNYSTKNLSENCHVSQNTGAGKVNEG